MDLFYRKYGQGKPVIILHGLFGLSDNWVSIGKKISENNFCVYIPDMRNHGRSPKSNEFNYDLMTGDLDQFIRQNSIETPVLIGHSMGGKVVMNYALRHSGNTRKIIIVDIGIKKYPVRNTEIIGALSDIDLSITESRHEVEALLALKIHSSKLRQLLMQNLYRKPDNRFEWKINLPGIRNNFPAIFNNISYNKPFNGSALFIRGELSDNVREEDFPGIRELFPKAQFHTIHAASHWVHADKPEEFIKTILNFLQSAG